MKVAMDTSTAIDHLKEGMDYDHVKYLLDLHARGQIQLCMAPYVLLRDVPKPPLREELADWVARHRIQPLLSSAQYGATIRDPSEARFIGIPLPGPSHDAYYTASVKLNWDESESKPIRYGKSFDTLSAMGDAYQFGQKHNKDWDIVEAAYVGRCDALITRDKRMIAEGLSKNKLWITSPEEFAAISKQATVVSKVPCAICGELIVRFEPTAQQTHGHCKEMSEMQFTK